MFCNTISFYILFAVHLPKCFSTVTTFQKCTLSSSIRSQIYSDRRLLGYGIEWFQPSGFCECVERCYKYGNCYSVNYNRIQLSCTINAQKAEGSVTMETAEGWEYVEIPENFTDDALTSNGCSSCPADHRCVALKNSGSFCVDTIPHMHSDVLFLLDVSGSVSDEEWSQQKDFSKSVALELQISLHGDNVALFGVNTYASEVFSLTSYYDVSSVLSAIDAAVDSGGNSNYERGLEDAYDYLIVSRRSGYKTFIIGVTDHPGAETDALTRVSQIGNSGINVVTLGHLLTETGLATDPDYFFATNFSSLAGLSDNVASIILNKYF